jgi:hypothetical protein
VGGNNGQRGLLEFDDPPPPPFDPFPLPLFPPPFRFSITPTSPFPSFNSDDGVATKIGIEVVTLGVTVAVGAGMAMGNSKIFSWVGIATTHQLPLLLLRLPTDMR